MRYLPLAVLGIALLAPSHASAWFGWRHGCHGCYGAMGCYGGWGGCYGRHGCFGGFGCNCYGYYGFNYYGHFARRPWVGYGYYPNYAAFAYPNYGFATAYPYSSYRYNVIVTPSSPPFSSYEGWIGTRWGASPPQAGVYRAAYADGTIRAPAPDRLAPVHVDVNLPDPEAELIIQGYAVASKGNKRTFVSPAIPEGQVYSYTVTMRRQLASRQEEQTRMVDVVAGGKISIDFTKAVTETHPPSQVIQVGRTYVP